MMDVVSASRYRGAEVIGRNVPRLDIVVGFEQRAIEHAHRVGVLEIYRRQARWVADRERLKLWHMS